MSTTIQTPPTASAPRGHSAADAAHLTFPRIVRSEWIKFRTLRSTVWTLAITLVIMVGIVTIFSGFVNSQLGSGNVGNPDDPADVGVIFAFTIAANLAQLAVAVLGVLVITGEYSTGMIRSTLTAVPQRLPALWAKCVVLAVSVFAVSTLAAALSLGVMQLFLGDDGLVPDLGDSESLRIVAGVPLYLTAIALFSLAVGALLRHSAGALAAVLGLLLVIENLFLIPWKPLQYISPFMPATAGSKILTPQSQLDLVSQGAVGAVLGPWAGYAVLLAWVVVLTAVAAVALRRRNA